MQPVKIEFFHDVICSFCFPMSYRMRKLQILMPEVEVIHRSFALVRDESDFVRMFGSREAAKAEILTHWDHANQNDDLHRFNSEGMRKADFLFPLSLKPLCAAKAAYFVGGNDAYWDLFDALQEALFVKSENIEADEVIFEQVKHAGLAFDAWMKYYQSDAVKEAVEEDFALARQYGLHGVPALVINEKTIVQGAVSLNEIVQVVESAGATVPASASENGVCSIDGCS